MKVSKLVLLALIGTSAASKAAHKHHKSLTQIASESDTVDPIPVDNKAA